MAENSKITKCSHRTIYFQHSNFILAEIRLKTVERAQLNFHQDFEQISSKLAEIRPMVGFFFADLGEIQPVWENLGQLGRYSTKIGGGNKTARVRPFLILDINHSNKTIEIFFYIKQLFFNFSTYFDYK
jgi:hypothetical protein